ncbi:unnamed protein product [Merluccius merluccius]
MLRLTCEETPCDVTAVLSSCMCSHARRRRRRTGTAGARRAGFPPLNAERGALYPGSPPKTAAPETRPLKVMR